MARYIDADELYRRVKTKTNPYGKPTLDYESGVKVLDMINQQHTADVVPKSEVDQLKKALEAQDAEYTQALQDKARECNMAVDKICLEHRAKLALLHSSHEQELAKAKRDIARKVIAEVDLLISKYHLEPYYSVNDMEIDIAELRKKFTKGATDGKADCENGGIDV